MVSFSCTFSGSWATKKAVTFTTTGMKNMSYDNVSLPSSGSYNCTLSIHGIKPDGTDVTLVSYEGNGVAEGENSFDISSFSSVYVALYSRVGGSLSIPFSNLRFE